MASVTMKALSLNLTTIKPLTAPTSAPMSGITAIPTAVGSPIPNPDDVLGMTSIAPRAGAIPTMDSSERSNLPVMMISDSATTTNVRAAEDPRMLTILAWVRKLGLTTAPIIMRAINAGTSARSLNRVRSNPIDWRSTACQARLTSGESCTKSSSLMMADSLDC
jgi:hypothetical protein